MNAIISRNKNIPSDILQSLFYLTGLSATQHTKYNTFPTVYLQQWLEVTLEFLLVYNSQRSR